MIVNDCFIVICFLLSNSQNAILRSHLIQVPRFILLLLLPWDLFRGVGPGTTWVEGIIGMPSDTDLFRLSTFFFHTVGAKIRLAEVSRRMFENRTPESTVDR